MFKRKPFILVKVNCIQAQPVLLLQGGSANFQWGLNMNVISLWINFKSVGFLDLEKSCKWM